ncbi:MAG: nitronate monooxygenase [Pseudomonadota bacterium]
METLVDTNNASGWPLTPLTRKLGIQYPIIQGPLGGFDTRPLAATVSNFGGLGSFGAHGLTPDAISSVIADLRARTAKPFAINLWVSMEDERASSANAQAFARSLRPLAPYIAELGGTPPTFKPFVRVKFEAQARAVLDAKVPVFSFVFGIPPREILEECRQKGILTVGGATTPEEASELEQAGVDAILASGFESGGHRGSFLRPSEESLFGTFSLVPLIVDRVSVPVIAAGGIADARGVAAALALGASAVQLGTAFLGSAQAGISPLHRELILQGKAARTALSRGFTGRLARAIQNELLSLVSGEQAELLPYPLQRALVKNLTVLAEKAGRPELMQLWAGQSAPLSRYPDPLAFLEQLVAELSQIAPAISAWTTTRKAG